MSTPEDRPTSMSSHRLAQFLLGMPDRPVVITDEGDEILSASDSTYSTGGPDRPCVVLETTN